MEDIRQGKMVILVDDEDRENEGDLVMAAELVTPEAINFMGRQGCGLICLTLTEERADHLALPLMLRENSSSSTLGFNAGVRDYGIGVQILASLGIRQIRLMTNNPKKIIGLQGYGLEIIERVPLEIQATGSNIRYLKTKREKLGHLLVNLE